LVPVSFNEYVNVVSGNILVGTAGLELYTAFPHKLYPTIIPVDVPRTVPRRFRIDWKRGLIGATVATTAVALGILAPEIAGGGYTIARIAAAFA
jgi:hypothetical protein